MTTGSYLAELIAILRGEYLRVNLANCPFWEKFIITPNLQWTTKEMPKLS